MAKQKLLQRILNSKVGRVVSGALGGVITGATSLLGLESVGFDPSYAIYVALGTLVLIIKGPDYADSYKTLFGRNKDQ